jgi:cholesterol transport system auxiliary component
MIMTFATYRANRHAGICRRQAVGDILGLGIALPLSGCGVLPRVSEPVNLYTLTPKTTYPPGLPQVDWQLIVEAPVADVSLNTSRIALKRTPLTFEYYADSAWTDNAPAMVQTLLIESFERTGRISAVGREAIGLRPDYILKTDLRDFQAIYDGADPRPHVLVRMNAKVVKMPQRRIIASATYEDRNTAAGNRLVDIVAAFDDALGRVLKQIVLFTLDAPSLQT